MKIPPFKLERFFAKYEFKAPYLLSSSDCESLTIRDLLALEPEAAAALQEQWLGYTESQGQPQLRAEIAGLYRQINPEQVLVHAGAQEAIFGFMNALLSPGDHVIVHYPCYQSLIEVARSAGCEVTPWPAAEEDDWELDLEFLRRNIKSNTRALVINLPHNPTGYLPDPDKFAAIVGLAQEHNLLLFSDEVYRELEYNPADTLPAACDLYERAVSLGVMSKAYGLAGLRIGWIATREPEVYQAMAAFKDYTSICNSAPSEFLAGVALRHRAEIVGRNLEIIRANLAILNGFFERHQNLLDWVPPKAGSIAFPSLKIDQEVESFCLDLVEKEGVLLLPGTTYDFGSRHFRVGFGRKRLPEAVERLEAYLEERY